MDSLEYELKELATNLGAELVASPLSKSLPTVPPRQIPNTYCHQQNLLFHLLSPWTNNLHKILSEKKAGVPIAKIVRT